VSADTKPIIIVGAGPIGLTTALALDFYGLPYVVCEEDSALSLDTKAGTTLTRTLEAFRRYGVVDRILACALRVDEIGDIERATGRQRPSVQTALLRGDTRFPFVINLPQHHFEPILASAVAERRPEALLLRHRLVSFRNGPDGVTATFETPDGEREIAGSYMLACDGGRSTVRAQLDIPVEGKSLDVRYMLVDLKLDLDISNPRDYPYLAYFSDPQEWMVLVRQPHCWRFLFPLAADAEELSPEELRDKVLQFIGEVDHVEILGTVVYRVHHRIATEWRRGRVFLMGDAAHLITPMWALGLNTGVLDTLNLPWRLAWVIRGWADEDLLDGYAREQRPVAAEGSGEMAEAARQYMAGRNDQTKAMAGSDWANAYTRCLLGVRLDVAGSGDWSMIKTETEALRVGDRIPDFELHGPDGKALRAHDLTDKGFVALYFTDARRLRPLPKSALPGLRHYVVSRWDAPLDTGLREQCLLDVGDQFRKRLACAPDTVVLVRPDDHVAAILPMATANIETIYRSIVRPGPAASSPGGGTAGVKA
jgi:3-(3-hydroxy-phenyl)propionate hydroxylase